MASVEKNILSHYFCFFSGHIFLGGKLMGEEAFFGIEGRMTDSKIQTEKMSNHTANRRTTQAEVRGTEKRESATSDSSIIGTRIRAIRRVRGSSLKETAKAATLSFQGLQAIETGADPRVSTLLRVAAALDVCVVDLLDGDRFKGALVAAADHRQMD